MNMNRVEHKILYALLLYMPFHYYICELLLPQTSVDNALRDVTIMLLLACSIAKNGLKVKVDATDMSVAVSMFVLIIFSVFSFLLNNYPATFNILRTYIIPMMIYFVTSRMEWSKNEINKIFVLIMIELAAIGTYGFFQAFFLKDDFLVKIGYPSNQGHLAGYSYYITNFYGFQRTVGTFISPNICGLILTVGLSIYFFSNCMHNKQTVLLLMLLIGLITTFSRSSILGFVIAYFITNYCIGGKTHINPNKIIIGSTIFVIACVVLARVDRTYLNGKLMSMISSSFVSVFEGTDTSTPAHMKDLIYPLKSIFMHPFGMGFGNNGPMAIDVSKDANLVESSFYLMAYEIGPVFAFVFFIPYFDVIISTLKNKRRYKFFTPLTVCITFMFTYLLLPNVQTYEAIFYSFLFIGLYKNKSVKKIYSGY